MTTFPVAASVINKSGGHKVVAKWLGIDVSRVYRMTYPKERGGTGGLIPAEHQQTWLVKARDAGVDLSPNDFFGVPQDHGSGTPS